MKSVSFGSSLSNIISFSNIPFSDNTDLNKTFFVEDKNGLLYYVSLGMPIDQLKIIDKLLVCIIHKYYIPTCSS